MSFHQCGGNVGDTVNFPLPVLKLGLWNLGYLGMFDNGVPRNSSGTSSFSLLDGDIMGYHITSFFLGDKMWGLTINNRDIFPMSWRLSDCLGFSLPSLCPTWLDCCCALHPCSIRKFHPDSWPERHGVWKWPRAKAFCTKAAWPIVAMGFPKPKLLSFATTSNN